MKNRKTLLVLGAVAALLSGRAIAARTDDYTFGWLYLSAGAVAVLSMAFLALIRDPTRSSPDRVIRLRSADLLAGFGDSLRDIQAGQSAGAFPILVKTGKGSKTLADNPDLNVPIFENLYDAAQFIISRQ